MSRRVYQIVQGLDGFADGFASLGRGPSFREIGELEAVFRENFIASQAAVHVITGKLKASADSHTRYDGDVWSGEITYLEDPGIFELARGSKPTANHPEGEHDNFFSVSEKYYPQYDRVLTRMLDNFWDDE